MSRTSNESVTIHSGLLHMTARILLELAASIALARLTTKKVLLRQNGKRLPVITNKKPEYKFF
jgi:hypothetical protein